MRRKVWESMQRYGKGRKRNERKGKERKRKER